MKKLLKKTIRTVLLEDTKNIVKLKFKSLDEYNKADEILYRNGFKRYTSMDSGEGRYDINENWRIISFNIKLKDKIVKILNHLNFDILIEKPIDYKIFNQGGYID